MRSEPPSLKALVLFLSLSFAPPGLLWSQEPREPRTLQEVRALLEKAGGSARWKGSHTVTAWDSRVVRVEESGLGHTRIHKVVKILDEEGAVSHAALRFDYDPASNLVEIKMVRVIPARGKPRPITSASILDLPQPQRMIIWGPRMKLVPLGRLRPGDAIEYVILKKGFSIAYLGGPGDEERFIPPMRGHFYDKVIFQEGAPLLVKYYKVVLPRDKPLRYKVYNSDVSSACDYTKDSLAYSFWKRNVPPFRPEPRAAAASDQCPKVVMATTAAWEEKSRWFYKVQEDRKIFDLAPRTDGLPGGKEEVEGIKALVARLTKGKDREGMIRALNHWVADNIRYMGITMGRGEGYTIHPGVMTFHDRCGVCKDKAGMLTTLLRAAGFEAYCGMTMAGSRVEDIPADQFNHCITAVREPDGSLRLLDPTWIPLSPEMWSSAEAEQYYVIGTGKGEPLRKTPLFGPARNRLFVEVETSLSRDGNARFRVEMHGVHYADQRMRRTLYGRTQDKVPDVFARWAEGVAPDFRGLSYEYDPDSMQDYSKPARVSFRFESPRYAPSGPAGMAFVPAAARPFPGAGFAGFLHVPLTPRRKQPLMLWTTPSIEVHETVTLPQGFKVERLPRERHLDGPAMKLSWKVVPGQRAGTLECFLSVEQKLRTIPPDDYPQFKEVVQAYEDLVRDPVLLERTR